MVFVNVLSIDHSLGRRIATAAGLCGASLINFLRLEILFQWLQDAGILRESVTYCDEKARLAASVTRLIARIAHTTPMKKQETHPLSIRLLRILSMVGTEVFCSAVFTGRQTRCPHLRVAVALILRCVSEAPVQRLHEARSPRHILNLSLRRLWHRQLPGPQ